MKVKELFETSRIVHLGSTRIFSSMIGSDGNMNLDYSEDIHNGDFNCFSQDKLLSLKGSPYKVIGDFDCSDNSNLISLEFSPEIVEGDYECSNCSSLTSLEGTPEIITGHFNCISCPKVTSLEGIGVNYLKEIHGHLIISGSIKSNMLGILKIKNLKKVPSSKMMNDQLKEACDIIDNHLSSGRRISKCRQELIEAGLKEFAKL
jgi:hypothetical protein